MTYRGESKFGGLPTAQLRIDYGKRLRAVDWIASRFGRRYIPPSATLLDWRLQNGR